MDGANASTTGVRQMVPLLNVADIATSAGFYVDGLGFRMTRQWAPDGVLRWCWLEVGDAALMIQQSWQEGVGPAPLPTPPGQGVTLCLMCDDALAIWRDVRGRGLKPDRPFVGNGLWVVSFRDPDGYRIDFESPTDVAEETVYAGD
ncbi:VOC family protein [Phenylobacterium sp.]|uniref:VOC family protein n=1 Tax=Phenylobacterium sp. TaxID=1871053 RepID=UPI003D289D17